MLNVRTTDKASIAPDLATDGVGGRSLGSRIVALARAAAAIHMCEAARPEREQASAQPVRRVRMFGGGEAA